MKTTARRCASLVALLVMALAVFVPASAFATTDQETGTVDWDGNGGENLPCTGDTHWILTPGGSGTIAEATLTVDGRTVAGERRGGGQGAIHFYSGPHEAIASASATYTSEGDVTNALLTISSCEGADEGEDDDQHECPDGTTVDDPKDCPEDDDQHECPDRTTVDDPKDCPEDDDQHECPDGTTEDSDGVCVIDTEVDGVVECPEGTTEQDGVCVVDTEVREVVREVVVERRGDGPATPTDGAVVVQRATTDGDAPALGLMQERSTRELPRTGAGSLALLLVASVGSLLVGSGLLRRGRSG